MRCESLPRWKNGARFAAALTHDVDDVQLYCSRGALRLLSRALRPTVVRDAGRRGDGAADAGARSPGEAIPTGTSSAGLAEEQRHGFRSTLLRLRAAAPRARTRYDALYTFGDRLRFEGASGSRSSELWRRLAGRGFEIGLHGSYSAISDAAELSAQERQIEHALGGAIGGTRQHFLRFDVGRDLARPRPRPASSTTRRSATTRRSGSAPASPRRSVPGTLSARRPIRCSELPLSLMDGDAVPHAEARRRETAARRCADHLDAVEDGGRSRRAALASERRRRGALPGLVAELRRGAGPPRCPRRMGRAGARDRRVVEGADREAAGLNAIPP